MVSPIKRSRPTSSRGALLAWLCKKKELTTEIAEIHWKKSW